MKLTKQKDLTSNITKAQLINMNPDIEPVTNISSVLPIKVRKVSTTAPRDTEYSDSECGSDGEYSCDAEEAFELIQEY